MKTENPECTTHYLRRRPSPHT